MVLKRRAGGSGTWYELAVMLNRDGHPEPAATLYFADRESMHDVTLTDGTLIIDATVNQPGDSLCCPSRRLRRVFHLCQGELVTGPLRP